MESAVQNGRGLISNHIFLVFFLSIFAYFAIQRCRQYWRLRHFSGPFGAGFSWLWNSWATISGNSHLYYGEVTEKYGVIAKIAPNHLITSSPELWQHVNAVRSPYKRAEWYYHTARFEPGRDNVFTECDSEKHDARRRKMTSGYAGKENPNLEQSIDTHVKELIHLIRSKYASDPSSTAAFKPMDISPKIQYFALDVISDLSLGEAFGLTKADTDINSYLASMTSGLWLGSLAFGLGSPRLLLPLQILQSLRKRFPTMMDESRKVIEARRRKSTDEHSDMISSFIRHGVEGDDLFQELFEQILAGSETVSAALRIIMLYIMTHPRVYTKVQAEIDEAVTSGIAPASPEIISDAEARRLQYLSAVIREGLRVHPPLANISSHIVPSGGEIVTVNGKEYFLPGGVMIGPSVYGMHRHNTALYGEDPHVFRPERWFVDESDPTEKQRLARMYKTNDMIFGYGRWKCLGSTVALIEIHKVVFELCRNFDWAVTNPQKPWSIANHLGLFAIRDMWVDVTERGEAKG